MEKYCSLGIRNLFLYVNVFMLPIKLLSSKNECEIMNLF